MAQHFQSKHVPKEMTPRTGKRFQSKRTSPINKSIMPFKDGRSELDHAHDISKKIVDKKHDAQNKISSAAGTVSNKMGNVKQKIKSKTDPIKDAVKNNPIVQEISKDNEKFTGKMPKVADKIGNASNILGSAVGGLNTALKITTMPFKVTPNASGTNMMNGVANGLKEASDAATQAVGEIGGTVDKISAEKERNKILKEDEQRIKNIDEDAKSVYDLDADQMNQYMEQKKIDDEKHIQRLKDTNGTATGQAAAQMMTTLNSNAKTAERSNERKDKANLELDKQELSKTQGEVNDLENTLRKESFDSFLNSPTKEQADIIDAFGGREKLEKRLETDPKFKDVLNKEIKDLTVKSAAARHSANIEKIDYDYAMKELPNVMPKHFDEIINGNTDEDRHTILNSIKNKKAVLEEKRINGKTLTTDEKNDYDRYTKMLSDYENKEQINKNILSEAVRTGDASVFEKLIDTDGQIKLSPNAKKALSKGMASSSEIEDIFRESDGNIAKALTSKRMSKILRNTRESIISDTNAFAASIGLANTDKEFISRNNPNLKWSYTNSDEVVANSLYNKKYADLTTDEKKKVDEKSHELKDMMCDLDTFRFISYSRSAKTTLDNVRQMIGDNEIDENGMPTKGTKLFETSPVDEKTLKHIEMELDGATDSILNQIYMDRENGIYHELSLEKKLAGGQNIFDEFGNILDRAAKDFGFDLNFDVRTSNGKKSKVNIGQEVHQISNLVDSFRIGVERSMESNNFGRQDYDTAVTTLMGGVDNNATPQEKFKAFDYLVSGIETGKNRTLSTDARKRIGTANAISVYAIENVLNEKDGVSDLERMIPDNKDERDKFLKAIGYPIGLSKSDSFDMIKNTLTTIYDDIKYNDGKSYGNSTFKINSLSNINKFKEDITSANSMNISINKEGITKLLNYMINSIKSP